MWLGKLTVRNMSPVGCKSWTQIQTKSLSGLAQRMTDWWIFSYFNKLTGYDILYKLSQLETNCMKCQSLFLVHLSRSDKVSFCGHILFIVHPSSCACIRACVFKWHLLINHWLDFDQTSQKWSLVSPLLKLFKWFWSVAHLGHRS